jgi:phosphopantothenate-cysteine ligase
MNILISAGGNTEKIDEVRAIRNTGTGRLGTLIAEKLALASAENHVFYICDRHAEQPFMRRSYSEFQERYGAYDDIAALSDAAERISVSYADDVSALGEAVKKICGENKIDGVVHSMAVSDYRVKNVTTALNAGKAVADAIYIKTKDSLRDRLENYYFRAPIEVYFGSESGPDRPYNAEGKIADMIRGAPGVREGGKISSDLSDVLVVLEKAPKIISLYRGLAPDATIIGFKLLTDVSESGLIRVGYSLLKKNDCDYVLANDMKYLREGRHIGHLIKKDGGYATYDGKDAIADAVANAVRKKR